ncbi:MAG: alpha/beta hydrolase, partial [Chitinophagaceae bacterium]
LNILLVSIPSKLPSLVPIVRCFVGAYLPQNGQSLFDLANTDAESLLPPALIPSKDQLTLDIKKDQVINIFCQDGSALMKLKILVKFKVEPAIRFVQPATVSEANFGKVPKYYIQTLQDHAVGPDLQKRMIAAAKIDDNNVYPLNSSHCPFLSMPDAVTDLLFKISR